MRSLPKKAKVIQWALSDVTDSSALEGIWRRTCVGTGDVEFGKWVVEEKGVAPTTDNFRAACLGNHGNVELLKWLFQKVGGYLCPDDLVEALHSALAVPNRSISRWLEQQITTTTGSRPKVSLSKIPWRDIPQEDCPSEVLSVVKASIKGEFTVKTKLSTMVSKLILKLFPNITRDVAIMHFMYIIASTPLHAQFTANNTNLGITLDDIKDFCNA
ncbi:hypothetical protein Pelo_17204 [Pelomyxa schiedti]|nr:hypothetical protein Pelo_17204 [Pelomyxa schiedti]